MTLRVVPIAPEALLDGERLDVADLCAMFDLDPDIMERLERILRPEGRETLVLAASEDGDPAVLGFAVGSIRETDPGLGVVEMIGVRSDVRRRGVATVLLREVEEGLAARGAGRLTVMGNAPVYAWPGVDVRYTAGLCFFERRGYLRSRDAIDMTVDLAGLSDSGAFAGALVSTEPQPLHGGLRVVALGADGSRIRRAAEAWIAAEFAPSWRREVEQALARADEGRVAGVVVAVRPPAEVAEVDGTDGDGADALGEVVGFAAYGAQRAALFGPMGTDESARGTGVGTRLLMECFAAQHAAGLTSADIGWVGPTAFYSRMASARISRTYALLTKGV